MDATKKYISDHQRKKAYRRLDRIRNRIKRERILIAFHGEDSFAGFMAGTHLDELMPQRNKLIRFLDRN